MSIFSHFRFPRQRQHMGGPGRSRRTEPTARPRLHVERLEDRALPSGNAISGYVFNDLNNNGLLDAGESGIANVSLELHNASGVVIATANSDANGFYQFKSDNTIDTSRMTLQRTASVASTPTDWTNTLSVAKFDPALGTLTAVDLVNTGSITSQIKVENLDPAPATITATVSGSLTLSGAGFDALTTNSSASKTFSAAAFDGTLDFENSSGHDFGPQSATGSTNLTITDATDLAYFIGAGSVALTEVAHATSAATGAGNLVARINTTAASQVSVIYHYIPNNCLKVGTYTIVQSSKPVGFVDGKLSSNGAVLPNSTGTRSIPVTLGTSDLPNNDFAELVPGSNLTGMILADSFAFPADFAHPLDVSILSKLQFLSFNQAADPNVLAQAYFVDGLYRHILDRPADATGLTSWVQQLEKGVSRAQVVDAIWNSAEHRGLEVDRLYATFLQRSPDVAGRAGWVNALLAGTSEMDVAHALILSGEFQGAHADNASYVTALYATILRRTPSAAERSSWVTALQNGASRDAVAVDFLRSAESYQLMLNCDYTHLLHRAPDAAGNQVWLAQLLSGQVTPAEVAQSFLASDEFFALARDASRG